jgi:hypothetical protein
MIPAGRFLYLGRPASIRNEAQENAGKQHATQISFGLILGALMAATATFAQVSDASKLGANAGAIEYCCDNFMTDDDNGRYALLVAATTKDLHRSMATKPRHC